MTIFNVFSLFGGLALFLFGMDIMGKALEKQAGGQLQKILSKLTDNPVKGFFLGLCVTAIIQSSSATTVMVVGFVNSGIMELHQAIGVIMGSNVGTTVTSWILSLSGLQGDSLLIQMLKPTSFSPVLAFIGILLYMGKNEKRKGIGTIMIGFAILMTGMDHDVQRGGSPGRTKPGSPTSLSDFSNPILGVLVGAIVTGVIQSSTCQCRHPAGLERHGRYHLRQCHPHHHGPEYWYLRHCTALLGGCQQECPPGCYGPSVLQHHRRHAVPDHFLWFEQRAALHLCQ